MLNSFWNHFFRITCLVVSIIPGCNNIHFALYCLDLRCFILVVVRILRSFPICCVISTLVTLSIQEILDMRRQHILNAQRLFIIASRVKYFLLVQVQHKKNEVIKKMSYTYYYNNRKFYNPVGSLYFLITLLLLLNAVLPQCKKFYDFSFLTTSYV